MDFSWKQNNAFKNHRKKILPKISIFLYVDKYDTSVKMIWSLSAEELLK